MSKNSPNAKQPNSVAPKAPATVEVERKAKADRAETPAAPVATKVYVHAIASGPRGALAAVPLHEVPLLRRKLQAFGESLALVGEWPENSPRERTVMRGELASEYERLVRDYVFTPPDANEKVDLVTDVFGPFQGGRYLIEAMNAVHGAWLGLAKHCAAEEREPTEDELLQVLSSIDHSAIQSDTIDADA